MDAIRPQRLCKIPCAQVAFLREMKKRKTARLIMLVGISAVCIASLSTLIFLRPIAALLRPAPTPTGSFAVDPLFRDFYQSLGGLAVLGQPLAPRFEQNAQSCQYTQAVLMCFDPAESDPAWQYRLEPLGTRLGVRDSAPFASPQMGSRDLGGGYVLYDEFAALYESLRGGLYAGRPLTQLRVNQENQRYEQFFENLGFYRRFDDPPGSARLIPYGAYLCGPDCSRDLAEYWGIVQANQIDQPFELSLRQRGWSDLGAPLAQPRLAEDGALEQVYDGAVLYAPHDQLDQLRFRPLVRWLRMAQDNPLVPRSAHEKLVFYEVKDGLGHNVPDFFDAFIASHGGRELAGQPLSEMFERKPGQLFRQCFESYCLDYHLTEAPEQRVRLAPLGLEYAHRSEPTQSLRQAFSAETVLLQVEEASPLLGKGEAQRIRVHVRRQPGARPMYLVDASLTLVMPGKPAQLFNLRPTDQDGATELVLPPIEDLPAMSIIEYQVCLNLPSIQPICQTDSFLYSGN